MADAELSLFSYEILGLVGRGGAGPHDLLRMARRGRMLAWAGESRYYTEPKRLAELGYLSAHKSRASRASSPPGARAHELRRPLRLGAGTVADRGRR